MTTAMRVYHIISFLVILASVHAMIWVSATAPGGNISQVRGALIATIAINAAILCLIQLGTWMNCSDWFADECYADD